MLDSLGDRMKDYENVEAKRQLVGNLPICIRLDGKRFSKFTKGLERPYDERFRNLMLDTTKFLMGETSALVGYTQSDEITLILYEKEENSQTYLNGRIQKLTSILASMCSVYFNRKLSEYIPEKQHKMAFFDCRAWVVPTKEEAVNVLLWRELDCTRNAIKMAAQAYFSHNDLFGKSGEDMKKMLEDTDINWDEYPSYFTRGVYLVKRTRNQKFTAEELEKLPPKHLARTNPDLLVSRKRIENIDMPPLLQVKNRVDVIFNNVEPEVESTDN